MPFRIRELREKRKMTQTELCKKKYNVFCQTFISLESGKMDESEI